MPFIYYLFIYLFIYIGNITITFNHLASANKDSNHTFKGNNSANHLVTPVLTFTPIHPNKFNISPEESLIRLVDPTANANTPSARKDSLSNKIRSGEEFRKKRRRYSDLENSSDKLINNGIHPIKAFNLDSSKTKDLFKNIANEAELSLSLKTFKIGPSPKVSLCKTKETNNQVFNI